MNRSEEWKKKDERMNYKLDFMYNHMDYDHDRAKVRSKFLDEINRRTTLEDIGEKLDQFILDSKAQNYKHYNLAEHHNVQAESKGKSYGDKDFQWSSKLLSQQDPKAPSWFEDQSQINKMSEEERDQSLEIVE